MAWKLPLFRVKQHAQERVKVANGWLSRAIFKLGSAKLANYSKERVSEGGISIMKDQGAHVYIWKEIIKSNNVSLPPAIMILNHHYCAKKASC